MQVSNITFLSAFSSTILALAVVLSGVHAKDLAGLTNDHSHFDVKAHGDEGRSKVSPELHNHIDKTSFKSLLKAGADTLQADSRSLRVAKGARKQSSGLSLLVWFAKVRLFSLF